jgi:hypothetical protein
MTRAQLKEQFSSSSLSRGDAPGTCWLSFGENREGIDEGEVQGNIKLLYYFFDNEVIRR